MFGILSGWTVFETPSTAWVPNSRPFERTAQIKRVSASSSSSSSALDSDGSMPLEFPAGSELRRRPAPLLYLRLLAAFCPGRREELRRRPHAHVQALTSPEGRQ